MSRRPSYCRCCLRPSAGSAYCQGCGDERARTLYSVRSVISEVWGDTGLVRFDAAMRARRVEGARRGRGRRAS